MQSSSVSNQNKIVGFGVPANFNVQSSQSSEENTADVLCEIINSYQRRIQSLEEQVAIISKSVGYADGFKELNPIENLSTFKKYTEEDVNQILRKYDERFSMIERNLISLLSYVGN